jgi:hypothetical protein
MLIEVGLRTNKYVQIFNRVDTGYGGLHSSLMMEAARTSETSVDNYFIRQYIPEDNSEHL